MPTRQIHENSLKNLTLRKPQAPLWTSVHFGPTCYEWMGALDEKGYGLRTVAGKTRKVHRLAWELLNGEVPKGMHVLHSCDNRRCVRHDHLRLGTHAENMRDMMARGRHGNVKVTHCPRGHEYTPENTVVYRGSRDCRACRPFDKQRERERKESGKCV